MGEKISAIYQLRNLTNNRVYIGSSKNVLTRLRKHRLDLRKGKHHSSRLQHAWNKYGEKNFRFEILEITTPEDRLVREQAHIDATDSSNRKYGYNIYPIAGSPRTVSLNAGSKHGLSKLTEEDVREIKQRLASGETSPSIARDFNVNARSIRKIGHGTRWKHVHGPPRTYPDGKGINNPSSKLCDDDILAIRQRIKQGDYYTDIAHDYGVSGTVIRNIAIGKIWSHVCGYEVPPEELLMLNIQKRAELPKKVLPRAKITGDDVISIRARLSNGDSVKDIARDYNLTTTSIYNIRHRNTWAHV